MLVRFLASAAIAGSLSGAGALAASSGGAAAPAGTWSFRSEPALSPMKVTVDASRAAQSPRLLFVAPFSSGQGPLVGQAGPLIMDSHGNPVWFRPLPAGQEAADFRVQTLHGHRVLVWWQGVIAVPPKVVNVPAGTPEPGGRFIVLDRHYRQIASVLGQNGWDADQHEILITPRGTLLFEAVRAVPADLTRYGGPKQGELEDFAVQEVDLRTGHLVYQWDMLKHVSPSEAQVPVPPRGIWDPFHMNSIDYDSRGHLLISARNTSAIYEIDRASGRIDWQLGGKSATIRPTAAASFAFQHDARYLPGGRISLFDDACCSGPHGLPAHPGRGLILKLDRKRQLATVVSQYGHEPPLIVPSQGNFQALAGGGGLVGWGQQPFLTEYSGSGRVVLEMKMPGGDESYRALLSSWVGLPLTSPRLAVSSSSGRLSVSASWNGATQVSSWRVLGGRDATHLKVLVRKAPRRGFETTIVLGHTSVKYIVVRALGPRGHVLGSAGVSTSGGGA